MTIQYPSNLVCSNCNKQLGLFKKQNIYSTPDVISMVVEIPHTEKSAKDALENKEFKNYSKKVFIICVHCSAVLGVHPHS